METARETATVEHSLALNKFVEFALAGVRFDLAENSSTLHTTFAGGPNIGDSRQITLLQYQAGIMDVVHSLNAALKDVCISHHVIDDLDVYIVDNVLDPTEAQHYHAELGRMSYGLREHDFVGDEYPIFSSNHAKKDFLSDSSLGTRILFLMRKLFTNEAFKLNRAYVNLCRYGDMEYPHRDCGEHSRDITALYYGTSEWKTEYGGETFFYHSDSGTALAVAPLPGRLVLFRGAILHVGTVPTRICTQARYSLALKFGSRTISQLRN